MAKGRKTGGRKPGSKNKRSSEFSCAKAAFYARIEEEIGEDNAFKGRCPRAALRNLQEPTVALEIRVNAAEKSDQLREAAADAIDAKFNGESVSLESLIVASYKPPRSTDQTH